MAKLNQIVAVVNGKKTQTQKQVTELYKKVQNASLFSGMTRTYRPVDEDGDELPPEKTLVRANVGDLTDQFTSIMSDLLDVVATQDYANTEASGTIQVGNVTIAENVPVTHLMFLEKQLTDLRTFISALPTLDETSEWRYDENKGCYASEPEVKNRDLKFTEHKVVVEPTEHHPAHVEAVNITRKAGEFTTVKLSGAIPVVQKRKMLDRVGKLQEAVKFAREEANSVEVKQVKVSDKLFNFVFED